VPPGGGTPSSITSPDTGPGSAVSPEGTADGCPSAAPAARAVGRLGTEKGKTSQRENKQTKPTQNDTKEMKATMANVEIKKKHTINPATDPTQ